MQLISILNFRATSDTACTLVRKEMPPEKQRKSSRSLFTPPRRDIGILFVGYTHLRYSSFYILLSCARAKTRDAIAHTTPQFEHCRGLIGSYRAVMSHNGADNARDNTPPASRDYPAFLTRDTHPPIHRRLLSSLRISTSRQLNKHNS